MIIYEGHRSFSNYEIYRQYDESLSFGVHLHNSFELLYVNEGEIEISLDGREHLVREGEAVMIFPNTIHSYKTPAYSKTSLFIFSNKFIQTFYGRNKSKVPLSPIFKPKGTDFLGELKNEEINIYLAKSIFYSLVYQLDSQTEYIQRSTKRLDGNGRILNYIAEHYSEPITVKDVAKELGYDHRYVTSLIKEGFNTTFRGLLNEYRISHAQYLILTENKKISQIAYECGYDSICSFNRNFKELTGTTPRLYRKNDN